MLHSQLDHLVSMLCPSLQARRRGDAVEVGAPDVVVVGETLITVTMDAIRRGREMVDIAAAVDGTREGQHMAYTGPPSVITVNCVV